MRAVLVFNLICTLSFPSVGFAKPMTHRPCAQHIHQLATQLLKDHPDMPLSLQGLKDYLSLTDRGGPRFPYYTLAILKREIRGKQRYVFLVGENHFGGLHWRGPQALLASLRALRHFKISATEGRRIFQNSRWLFSVEFALLLPLRWITYSLSAAERVIIRAKLKRLPLVDLEQHLSPESKQWMQSYLRSEAITLSLVTLYLMSFPFLGKGAMELFPYLWVDKPIPSWVWWLFGTSAGINILTGLLMHPRLPDRSQTPKPQELQSLGQYHYLRSHHREFYFTVYSRDRDMSTEIVVQFIQHPDWDHMLTAVGKAHIAGMAKLLHDIYGFTHIPLRFHP